MADGPPAGGLREPAERGRLTVLDRAVERVAGFVAANVDGVARVGSNLEGVLGRRYPKVDARVAGGRVRVTIEIAVTWPASLPQVTGAVRQDVHDRLTDLVGLHVDAVDVTAAKVVLPQQETIRRVQ